MALTKIPLDIIKDSTITPSDLATSGTANSSTVLHGNDSWAYDQRGFDYIMRDQFGYNYAIRDKIFMTKDRDKFQRLILKAAANDNFSFEGVSKSEACDLNDHLTLMLPKGKEFIIKTKHDQKKISIEKEEIIDLKILH